MTRAARRRGLLVALEGIDGTGKSTLARALASALRRRGWSVAVRREPADPRLGRLAQEASVRDPWTGAVYFTVDRHLARPALRRELARREIVLTDRSFFSTLAYQGSALPPRERARLERLQRGASVAPDRVLLLELAPGEALRRLTGRARARAPLERRRTLERVARAYRLLARRRGWVVLDARQSRPVLLAAALEALDATGGSRTRRRVAGHR
ncbi:MAG: dTMP kinase [Thermoplasmata archaeon]